MTSIEFRTSPEYRSQLQRLLDDPVFTIASNIIVEERLCEDAPLGADAIVSIRLLSIRSGIETAFRALHELTTLPSELPVERLPDFGSGLSQAQLAQLEQPPLPQPFQVNPS